MQYQPDSFFEAESVGPAITFGGAFPNTGEIITDVEGGSPPSAVAPSPTITPQQQGGVTSWFAGLGTGGKLAVAGGAAAGAWLLWKMFKGGRGG